MITYLHMCQRLFLRLCQRVFLGQGRGPLLYACRVALGSVDMLAAAAAVLLLVGLIAVLFLVCDFACWGGRGALEWRPLYISCSGHATMRQGDRRVWAYLGEYIMRNVACGCFAARSRWNATRLSSLAHLADQRYS